MTSRGPARRRRVGLAFVATGTALAATALTLVPGANASSHREAPLILNTPAVDNTDVYAFTSPDAQDTVTLIASWAPFSEPNGGPNFYPWAEGAHYDINIDSDGDALPDTTYRWVFETEDLRDETFLYNNGPVETLDDENLLFRQSYDLIKITEDGEETLLEGAPVAPSNVGPASMPDYQSLVHQASIDVPGGGRSFAGQADDAFFLDLRVFDLLYGGDLSEVGQDTLGGYNTNTIALQVPKSEVALNDNADANPVIGVWSDTEKEGMDLGSAGSDDEGSADGGSELPGGADFPGLAEFPGLPEQARAAQERAGALPGQEDGFVQVSRLANPLVNELIPTAKMKDGFNASQPVDDAANEALLARVTDPELARLIEMIYSIPAPETPRNDLVEIFLTGITDKSGDQINVGPLNSQLDNADVNPEEFQPAEMMRLNMSTPVTPAHEQSRLGVLGGDLQGFPNGRRLTDDAVDIEIQAIEGAVRSGEIVAPLAAGDAVDTNNKPFLDYFPYIATANNEGVNTSGAGTAHSEGAGAVPPAGTSGPGGLGWPSAPAAVTGFAALALLGAGAFLMRRRPESGTVVPAG